MYKKLRFLAAVLISVLVFICLHMNALADFGDFSGGSDYGDSSYDSDYSYDYGDYDGSGSGGGIDVPSFIFACIVMAIFFMKELKKEKARNTGRSQSTGKAQAPGAKPTQGLMPVEAIRKWDPDFSDKDIKERLSNLYVQMQNCWQARDISSLRGYFTDAQYAQYDRQLQRYRDDRHTPVIERIAVLDVTLRGVQQDGAYDILVANLYTRITTFTIDDGTGQIIRGSRSQEKFMSYEWTLIRPRGARTLAQRKDEAFNCPNCGAPLNINRTAKCPYCDSIVTKANYDWVISDIKGLSQRTV